MMEACKTAAVLASGLVSCIVFICGCIHYVKRAVKHRKSTKGDRDLKKLQKLQAKVKKENK